MALEAIFPAADNPMFYPDMAEEGYLPHKISQLYVVGHDQPNVEIDVTADIDQKIQAILCHESQIADKEDAQRRWRERWGENQPDGTFRHFERFMGMKFG